MSKYRKTFEFFDTMKEATMYSELVMRTANKYYRKTHKHVITPWTSTDGSEHKYILWYYTK